MRTICGSSGKDNTRESEREKEREREREYENRHGCLRLFMLWLTQLDYEKAFALWNNKKKKNNPGCEKVRLDLENRIEAKRKKFYDKLAPLSIRNGIHSRRVKLKGEK